MKQRVKTETHFDILLRRIPFKTLLVQEISREGTIDQYLKTFLTLEDLHFSNWFHFEKNEMLLTETDTNPFVNLKGDRYLKSYITHVANPRNEHERKFGRKHMNINKGLFTDGLCYFVKKVYPRPKFLSTMYKVNFTNLSWIASELKRSIIKIDPAILWSMIEITYHIENENLIAKIRFSE